MKTSLFASRLSLIFTSLIIATLVSTVIVLGLDARLIARLGGLAAGIYSFTIFTTVFTLVTLVPLLFFAHTRPAHVVLQNKIVLPLLFLLWVFWLATAAGDSDSLSGFIGLCGNSRFSFYADDSLCSGAQALLAFAWLAWITITLAFGGLLTYAAREHHKGHRDVWSTSAYEYPFGTTAAATTANTGISSKDEAQPNMAAVNPAVGEQPRLPPAAATA